jgi:hypothetical protein
MSEQRDKNESNFSHGFVVSGDWKNSRKTVNGTHTKSSMSLAYNPTQAVGIGSEKYKSTRKQIDKDSNSNLANTSHVVMNPSIGSV